MKRLMTLLLAMVVVMGMMTSCTKDETAPEVTTFAKLTTYMSDQSMDLPDVLTSWLISASSLVGHESDYFIVDIRTAALFAEGHIEGAYNCPTISEIVDFVGTNNTNTLPVVIACYTGQSACRAVVALRLSGYSDAQSLGFGMSSWNSSLDRWTSSCTSNGVGHTNWSMDAPPALPNFTDEPLLECTATDDEGILAERVAYMLAKTDWGINNTDVLAGPETYAVFNYWGATDYTAYGHIAGAYQLTPSPSALKIAENGLSMLDPVGTNVVYCWTGQTSSMVTAWLDLLGYDVKSLKFGANIMIYSQLQAHKWLGSADYPLVTGS